MTLKKGVCAFLWSRMLSPACDFHIRDYWK